ncbi:MULTISPECIES: 2-octaprenyl-6-methoxyphenyl hydroxylase [unclassified Pseudoalteromonas]|uniref:2-octaprenyl-6-methoxyphenyl hydroxylase n=1 Tax=unclassified Pseudoalteromonas TaxID=194690 RepID=UPI000C8A8821|nr:MULTISPECIES: 2-octaprenyl-6-methoxyphenyl hydroxylase [unclassified Pseudoalteromonas]MCG9707746.1 2-octaprenyl-6-methoxyphenyl hydroxylase [Pseudoalteromonas sp. Isolate3]NIZ05491.1 2-octaprenyl-6-methoxyphenyl hydroxylase [Pseudoalteromonas sp. HF66]MAD03392.1 2-octaprenyl-6-methoxyphenyl hydroxylase [Pseudoalteromonas sp.]MCP4588930.1 2-octaprenyl-6-methoxyphenyl hydroxylase [Pseudoalteromonas sp.]URQ89554.1 2-octaprenyl-6-methoxyphenyl hydroxylase [Pseudoalteromonas sp. SCSIO 43101]
MAKQFDVVIIGGGMAGASCALGLKQSNKQLSIAVIEANEVSADYHPSFDDRSIALAQQSVQYLKSINAFDCQAPFAAAIEKVTVSDRGHFGKTHIDCQEYGHDALGYVVEVNPFGRSLHQQLMRTDVRLFCPDTVAKLEYLSNCANITLSSGEQLSAKLVVIADGAHSQSRKLANIEFNTRAYQQAAIIANIEVAGGHHHHAFERFTEYGPMALLPMSNNRYSLVWCMEPEQVEHYMTLEDDAFLAALQKAFGYCGGSFSKVGMRASYPLVYGKAESLSSHRTVLIGNAGHAIHPIAGQGFNLGLRDVQLLCDMANRSDLGDYAFTRYYSQTRSKDITTVMTLTDSLVRLFSNSSRLLALGRSIGLFSMDLFSSLKTPLAKQLMGQVKQGKRI